MKFKNFSLTGLSMLMLIMVSFALRLNAQTAPPEGLDFSVLSIENPVSSFEITESYKEALESGSWHSIRLNEKVKWNVPFSNDFFQLSVPFLTLGTDPYHCMLVSPAIDMAASAGKELSFLFAAGSVKGDSPLRVLLIDKDGNGLAELLSEQAEVGQNINSFKSMRVALPANLTGVAFIAFEGKGDKNNRSNFKVKEIKLAAANAEVSISSVPASLHFDAINVGETSVAKTVEFFISNYAGAVEGRFVGVDAADFALAASSGELSATGGVLAFHFAPQSAGAKNASYEVKAGEVTYLLPLSATANGGSTPEPSESVELLDDQFFYEFDENTPVKWQVKGISKKLEGIDAFNSSTGFGLGLDTRQLPAGENGFVKQELDLLRPGKEVKAGDEVEAMIHYYTDEPVPEQAPFTLAYKWLDAQGNVLNTAEESLILNNPELKFGRVKVWGELRVRSIAPAGATKFVFELTIANGAVVRVDDFSLLRLIEADRKTFISVVPQWQKLEGEVGNSYTHSFVVQSMHLESEGEIELHGESGVLTMANLSLPVGNKVSALEYQFNPKKKGIYLPGKPNTPYIEFNSSSVISKLLLTCYVIDPANPPTVAVQGATIDAMQAFPNESVSKELTFDVSGVIGSVNVAIEQEAGGAFRINTTQFYYSESQDQVLNNKLTLTFNPKSVGTYTARLALSSPMMPTKYYDIKGECLSAGELWTEKFEADQPLPSHFNGTEWFAYHRFDRGYYKLYGEWLEANKVNIKKAGSLTCDEWFENGVHSVSLSPADAAASLKLEYSVDGGGHWQAAADAVDGVYMINTHRPSRFRLVNKADADVLLNEINLTQNKVEDRINFDKVEDAMVQHNDFAYGVLVEDFAKLRHTRGFDLEGWQNLVLTADRPFYGWDQKNTATGDIEERCAQISFFKYQQSDDRKHESWLVSPQLTYQMPEKKILTFRLRYALPTENGQEKFGVYIITEEEGVLKAQYLDISQHLLVESFEDDLWYDFYIDLSTLQDIQIKDKFYVGFSLFSPVGGNATSLSFMIDDFSFGRGDLPQVEADLDMMAFQFIPEQTTAPQTVNVTVSNPKDAVTVHILPKKYAENFILSSNVLPAQGGALELKFMSKKPQDVAAKLLLQTRSGRSKVVKLLAQNATSVELAEASQTLKVYPTFAVDKLQVSASYLEYLIFNNSGQLQQKGTYAETIDVSRLSAGDYFIQFVLSEGEVLTRRFVRQ